MNGTKPFGWEVEVLISDRLVLVEATSQRKSFHYRGAESQARTRALCRPGVWKVVEVRPVDEITWRRVYGDPETRGL